VTDDPHSKEILSRLDALVGQVEQLAADQEEMLAALGPMGYLRADLLSLERRLDALLRRSAIDTATLGYPERIAAQRFALYSEHEGDGVVLALLHEIGEGPHTFVQLGCGQASGAWRMLATELGWSGLVVDPNPDATAAASWKVDKTAVAVVNTQVTPENVNEVVAANIEGDLGVLFIDVGSNDLWIWEAIDRSAGLVVLGFNARFGIAEAVAVPYNPEFDRLPRPAYSGASLAALEIMGERKGYRLVSTEPRSNTAFLLRDDLAPHIPRVTAAALHRPKLRPWANWDLGENAIVPGTHADQWELTEKQRQSLVDLRSGPSASNAGDDPEASGKGE
jgi:hypothetical protein